MSPPAYSSRAAAAATARQRLLLPTLTMEPAAVVWLGLDVEGEADEPDWVPVPVPVLVVPPVVDPAGALLDVALAARALNSANEREAFAAVLENPVSNLLTF